MDASQSMLSPNARDASRHQLIYCLQEKAAEFNSFPLADEFMNHLLDVILQVTASSEPEVLNLTSAKGHDIVEEIHRRKGEWSETEFTVKFSCQPDVSAAKGLSRTKYMPQNTKSLLRFQFMISSSTSDDYEDRSYMRALGQAVKCIVCVLQHLFDGIACTQEKGFLLISANQGDSFFIQYLYREKFVLSVQLENGYREVNIGVFWMEVKRGIDIVPDMRRCMAFYMSMKWNYRESANARSCLSSEEVSTLLKTGEGPLRCTSWCASRHLKVVNTWLNSPVVRSRFPMSIIYIILTFLFSGTCMESDVEEVMRKCGLTLPCKKLFGI